MAPRSWGRLERTRAGAQAPAGGSSGGGGNGRPVLGQSPEPSPHTHPGTRKLSGDCHPSRACQHLSGGTKPPIRGQESPRPETGPTHGSPGEPLDHGHGHQTPSTTPSPPGPELPGPSGRPQKRGGRGSRGQPPRAARAGRDRSVPPSESPGQDLEKNSAEAPPATGPGAGPWLPSLSRGSTYASSRPPPASGQRRDPRNSEREVRSDGPDPPRARVRAGDALPGPPSRAPGAGPRSSPGRDLEKKTATEEEASEDRARSPPPEPVDSEDQWGKGQPGGRARRALHGPPPQGPGRSPTSGAGRGKGIGDAEGPTTGPPSGRRPGTGRAPSPVPPRRPPTPSRGRRGTGGCWSTRPGGPTPRPAPGGAATATSLSSLHLQSPASGRRAHAPAPPGQIPPATPASRDSASVTAAESRPLARVAGAPEERDDIKAAARWHPATDDRLSGTEPERGPAGEHSRAAGPPDPVPEPPRTQPPGPVRPRGVRPRAPGRQGAAPAAGGGLGKGFSGDHREGEGESSPQRGQGAARAGLGRCGREAAASRSGWSAPGVPGRT